jgi:hypothetical protein
VKQLDSLSHQSFFPFGPPAFLSFEFLPPFYEKRATFTRGSVRVKVGHDRDGKEFSHFAKLHFRGPEFLEGLVIASETVMADNSVGRSDKEHSIEFFSLAAGGLNHVEPVTATARPFISHSSGDLATIGNDLLGKHG